MADIYIPDIFGRLLYEGCIEKTDIVNSSDGFFAAYKSLSDILLRKDILDVPGPGGKRLACSSFFDDWFLYAVPGAAGHTYSLFKMREQEHDSEGGALADGDMPGVTVSFISFDCDILLDCLAGPSEQNRERLNTEINRVVAFRGQRHHGDLKRYFADPGSEGAYLTFELYVRHIASFAADGWLAVPDRCRRIFEKSLKRKKPSRIPGFIDSLNMAAGHTVCDGERIYLANKERPTAHEAAAILATHTGNTSVYSFAAEVEYHARFLTPLAGIPIPLVGRSVYDSAIRADMTVGDSELTGPCPYYSSRSGIVKRQYELHRSDSYFG